VTLSPTLVVSADRGVMALSTPGGDQQDQGLLQVLLDAIDFGRNTEQAIETPRFQSEHLVSSFDNHEMHPGLLLLDERIPPAVAAELSRRKHRVEMRSRYNSGSAPVMIRLRANGTIEAGADPFYNRVAQAW
jgi:gamma-glutamyltranspeptidase/glutathione hydrolase